MQGLLETSASFWRGLGGEGGPCGPASGECSPPAPLLLSPCFPPTLLTDPADCLKNGPLALGVEQFQRPRRGGPGSPPGHRISQRAVRRLCGAPRQGRCRVEMGTSTHQLPEAALLPPALAPSTSWDTSVRLNLLVAQS